MYQEPKCVIVTKGSVKNTSSYICHCLLRKSCFIDAWQDSEYSSDSEYGRVLNMPGLHEVLNKMLHCGYLIGF